MADVSIRYNNTEIATMSASGTKVLKTEDTSCYTDVIVQYTDPSDITPKKDGKTYLYIRIPKGCNLSKCVVPLYWNQSVSNGVSVDWGDESKPFTVSGTGNVSAPTPHVYPDCGNYVITMTRTDDSCQITFGNGGNSTALLGISSSGSTNTCRSILYGVETGAGVTGVQYAALCRCAGLRTVIFGHDLATLDTYACSNAYSLGSIHFLGPTLPSNSNVSTGVWSELPEFCKIYVPATYIDASGNPQNIPSRLPSTSTYTYVVEPDAYTV